MSFTFKLQDLGIVALASAVLIYLKNRKSFKYPLPPSPKGRLPILGHALQIPFKYEWLTYDRWGKELNSDMIYLNAAGMEIIVVNSHQVIKDLFDSRSAKYSGRSSFTMVNELMGFDWVMPTLGYNKKWRDHRRIFTKYFSASNTEAYQPRILEFVRLLLPRLLDSPEDFESHIKHMVGGTVMSMAYGLRIHPENDPNVKLAQDALDLVTQALIPGKYLVDTIPILKHVPAWFPGTGFLQDAKVGREIMKKLLELPFAEAEQNIDNGTARLSFISMALEENREMEDSEEKEYDYRQIKELAATFFGAGYDTTHATAISLILALTCYPEVQAKARRELDAVVGPDRLPDFGDEDKLPYLKAVVTEVIRWHPVSGIGLPHTCTEDDIYQGYFIPKGTLIIPNQKGMLHDPEVYPEPEKFIPERFLNPDGVTFNPEVKHPFTIAFGFGRRMCPGYHLSVSEVLMMAASILVTMEIRKAKDGNGNDIEPAMDIGAGITSHPVPFRCDIRPRNKKAEELIRTSASAYQD